MASLTIRGLILAIAATTLTANAQTDEIDLDPPNRFSRPDLGYSIFGGIVGEYLTPLDSGAEDYTFRSFFTLRAELDLEVLAGIPGGGIILDGQANFQGGDLDNGDVQMLSTLDAPNSVMFAEAFFEQRLFDDSLTARVGVMDANSEFAAMPATLRFLNPSPSTTPTVAELPTWPATAPGIEAVYDDPSGFSFAAGVFDKSRIQILADVPSGRIDANGTYSMFEARYTRETEIERTRFSLGGWLDSAVATEVDGVDEDGTGHYVMLEHDLQWFGGEVDSRDLHLFATYSYTDAPVTIPFKRHFLLGAEWVDPRSRGSDDAIGLMWSRVDLNRSSELEARGAETVFETYYDHHFSENLDLITSLQYFDQVAGSGDDALVLGLRMSLVF